MLNLVGNAVKFTDQGEVILKVSESPNGIVFTVRDTGTGIPAEKLGEIFEPYNQGDRSRAHQYGGTGLGLTISKELESLMGGSIGVESEPGKGSTFTFTLPLQPVVPAAERLPSEVIDVLAGPPGRILVAEDEPAVRSMVEMLLRRNGWEVAIAENGRQAVEKWQEGGIDVILMDLKMSMMDGLAATQEIRAREGEHGR